MSELGVHSEVGRPRMVMVHRCGKYLRFVWPLLAILAVFTVFVLAIGAYLL
jgi:uncharacterized ion transporter superfamily protein YfcC